MVQITLTPEQFEQEKATIAERTNTVLSGNDGEITHNGVTLDFHYDGKSLLTIEVKHHPWAMPVSFIETQVRGWFKA